MKKLFTLMLLSATLVMSFSSCSKDEEIVLTQDQVVGTWDVFWAEQNGESMDVPEGYIYMTIYNNGSYRTNMIYNSYIGTYKISGNTIIGTTLDPIIEYYKFTSLENNKASIDYSNSVGDKYKFKAVKR